MTKTRRVTHSLVLVSSLLLMGLACSDSSVQPQGNSEILSIDWKFHDYLDSASWHRPAMLVDKEGTPHVVYSIPRGIQYATLVGEEWVPEVIEDDCIGRCQVIDFEQDSLGQLHLLYQTDRNQNPRLHHATRTSAGWISERVDPEELPTGEHASIAFDAENRPNIAYSVGAPDHELRFKAWDGTAWQSTVLDDVGETGGIVHLSMKNNKPRVLSHSDVFGFFVITEEQGGWVRKPFNTHGIMPKSIEHDANGNLLVVGDEFLTRRTELVAGVLGDEEITTRSRIGHAGETPSVARSSDGALWTAYWIEEDYTTFLARQSSDGSWQRWKLFLREYANGIQIAIGPDDRIYLIFAGTYEPGAAWYTRFFEAVPQYGSE